MPLPDFDEFPVFVNVFCFVRNKVRETLFELFNQYPLVLDLLHQMRIYFVFDFVKAREFELWLFVEMIVILSGQPNVMRCGCEPNKYGNLQLLFLLTHWNRFNLQPMRRYHFGFQKVFELKGLVHAHVQKVLAVHLR